MQPLHKDLKLLIVEDNQTDYVYLWELLREINSRALEEHWSFFSVEEMNTVWVQTLSDGLARISNEVFDIILLDLSLPDSEGIGSLDEIHKITVEMPVIVLSGNTQPELTFEAVTRGAQDFLVKGQFNSDQLARSIRYAIERKRIERELDQISRHKSQFLANMSHELRTPITSILGFAEIVQEELFNHPIMGRSINAVVRNAQHLLALLDDILDHSKIEAGKLVLEKIEVPLASIIKQASSMIELQTQSKGLFFEIVALRQVPKYITTDPLRLKQILVNLLTNAVKFTEKGGITVSVEYNHEAGNLCFKVKDSGIGISPEKQKLLFQPFTQGDPSNARQFGGSGLGLSITQHLVGLFLGKVELDSAEGRGSTFTVNLPVEGRDLVDLSNEMNAEHNVSKESLNMHYSFTGSVLLVEDTDDSRELIKLLLSRTGLQIDTANNGLEAVEKAKAKLYDLILMDLHIPHMDGCEATRIIRKNGYTSAVVALTARVTEDVRSVCSKAGCDDYISKPIKRKEFFQILGKYLKGGPVAQDEMAAVNGEQEVDHEMKSIVDSYIRELPNKLNLLVKTVEKMDWLGVKNEAHKLANAAMFGFPEISQLARRMEQAAMQEKKDESKSILVSLERCIGQIST